MVFHLGNLMRECHKHLPHFRRLIRAGGRPSACTIDLNMVVDLTSWAGLPIKHWRSAISRTFTCIRRSTATRSRRIASTRAITTVLTVRAKRTRTRSPSSLTSVTTLPKRPRGTTTIATSAASWVARFCWCGPSSLSKGPST